MAVDARQVSTASDTVVSRKIHRKSECVTTVVPMLAATSQADYEVVQSRPPDYGYMDSLPLGGRESVYPIQILPSWQLPRVNGTPVK